MANWTNDEYKVKMRALGAEIKVSIHDKMRVMNEVVFGANYNHERERQKLIKYAKEAHNHANKLSTGEYP